MNIHIPVQFGEFKTEKSYSKTISISYLSQKFLQKLKKLAKFDIKEDVLLKYMDSFYPVSNYIAFIHKDEIS